jgi:D-tyrosyl-tRNA(Tyr) deacylase
VASRVAGRIGNGYVLLVGFTQTDTEAELRWMADKVVNLRLFADTAGKLNHDITETAGALLVVSQFTLYADVRKGKRPSFGAAAPPGSARILYNQFVMLLRQSGLVVETGEFGADMEVDLINDGPVTIWLERESASRGLSAE